MPAVDFATKALRYAVNRVNSSDQAWVKQTYVVGRTVARRVANGVTRQQFGFISSLQAAVWLSPTMLEIRGFAYERGLGYPDQPPQIRVWLESKASKVTIEADVELVPDSAANLKVKFSDVDYANTGFVARFDLAPLLNLTGDARAAAAGWTVMIGLTGNGYKVRGWFNARFRWGSAGFLNARTHPQGQLIPTWRVDRGLVIFARRPRVMARELSVTGRRVVVDLDLDQITAAKVELVGGQGRVPCELVSGRPGQVRVAATVPHAGPDAADDVVEPDDDVVLKASPERFGSKVPVTWYSMVVRDTDGVDHEVAAHVDGAPPTTAPDSTLYAFSGPRGLIALRDTPVSMITDTVTLVHEPLGVRVGGRVLGDLTGCRVDFVGPRQILPTELTITGDRFELFCPLLVSTWGQPELPPMSGAYTLRGRTADGSWFRISTTQKIIDGFPVQEHLPGFRHRFEVEEGRRLQFRISMPRRDDEVGSYHQNRLEREYRARKFKPKNAIFFESFYGRISTCNPRALDAEVARSHPDWVRYWSVVDNSVAVPPGAIAVVEGTKEWWDARGSSRYLIVNDWIRRRYVHQPFQVVLQTWHGSMLKRIGLDRPSTDIFAKRALLAEREQWDLLLSQNPHSTEIFKSAYAWDKPILEEGYPRNDALASESGTPIREALGIAPHQTAVLYAPTWRDNQEEMVTFLDLAALTEALGPDYVVLLRGHSRTMGFGTNVLIPGVIDVTTYPDITALFLAADAMITDYSSVMFDYSATGKPMIFFVPDMDDYRDSVRGVYFDLSTVAPGPVLATQAEVLEAIRHLAADRPTYAEKYAAWQERFNPYDDGNSARRVIARLFATPPPRQRLKVATPLPE